MNELLNGIYLTLYLLVLCALLAGVLAVESRNLVTTEAIMSAETSSAVTPIEQRHYSAPAIRTFSEITERPLVSAGREPVKPAIAARVVTRGNV